MCVQIRVLEQSLCHVLRVSEWNPQWGEEAQGRETPNAGKGTLCKPRGDVWQASGSPRNPCGLRARPQQALEYARMPAHGCLCCATSLESECSLLKCLKFLSLKSDQDCHRWHAIILSYRQLRDVTQWLCTAKCSVLGEIWEYEVHYFVFKVIFEFLYLNSLCALKLIMNMSFDPLLARHVSAHSNDTPLNFL